MKNKNLKKALLANATFSTISGLTMLLFYKQLAAWMNITYAPIFLVIGIILLLFALFLFSTAKGNPISTKKVKFIILQDWLWVFGSILLIGTQAFGISQAGYIAIGVVALIVADLALLQHWFVTIENRE